MFKKKKMVEQDFRENESAEKDGEIPVNDRRRFNERGDRIDGADEPVKQPVRSSKEIELENKLRAETERREAAEAKLIGVQTKFDEAKNNLDRETADMRARLMKTLED